MGLLKRCAYIPIDGMFVVISTSKNMENIQEFGTMRSTAWQTHQATTSRWLLKLRGLQDSYQIKGSSEQVVTS